MKTYVLLDANILIRVVTQGVPGCEEASWHDLQKLGKKSAVTFLFPEVVELEVEKTVRNLGRNIDAEIKSIGDSIAEIFKEKKDKKRPWNEVWDTESVLKTRLEEWKKEKSRECQRRLRQVAHWIKSTSVIKLPLDDDLILRTKRRIIAGRVPGDPKEARTKENDCLIVDSLIRFFEKHASSENQLLMCTENLVDFGIEIKEKHANYVHPEFEEGLPVQSRIFTTLAELVEFAAKGDAVVVPTKKEVESAVEKMRIDEMTRVPVPTAVHDPIWMGKIVSLVNVSPESLEAMARTNRSIEPSLYTWVSNPNVNSTDFLQVKHTLNPTSVRSLKPVVQENQNEGNKLTNSSESTAKDDPRSEYSARSKDRSNTDDNGTKDPA